MMQNKLAILGILALILALAGFMTILMLAGRDANPRKFRAQRVQSLNIVRHVSFPLNQWDARQPAPVDSRQ